MDKKSPLKPLAAAAAGTTFAITLAAVPMAQADENPFAVMSLQHGYMVAADQPEGKCGEGKCGGDMKGEKKAEESADAKGGEGGCGGHSKEKGGEGKCGN